MRKIKVQDVDTIYVTVYGEIEVPDDIVAEGREAVESYIDDNDVDWYDTRQGETIETVERRVYLPGEGWYTS